jgi:ParB family chromosome partitioning protein
LDRRNGKIKIKTISISKIILSKYNVRRNLKAGTEDSTIEDLAKSIYENGLLNPITVFEKNDKYQLIVGKRRYLACKMLGWDKIPSIIKNKISDIDARILSLIENVHRADLHPLDKANAYKQIHNHYSTYTRVSKETGVSTSTIKRYLYLLKLAQSIQELLTTSDGPAGIVTLAKLAELFPEFKDQEYVLDRIRGFKQQVQLEILKQSGGDVEKIDELCDKAIDGCFSIVICRGIDSCPYIPEECLDEVKRIISQSETVALTQQISR